MFVPVDRTTGFPIAMEPYWVIPINLIILKTNRVRICVAMRCFVLADVSTSRAQREAGTQTLAYPGTMRHIAEDVFHKEMIVDSKRMNLFCLGSIRGQA